MVTASLINIIIPLEIFFDEFNSLINELAMHVYIETKAGKRIALKKVSRREDFLLKAGERYSLAYITSVEFLEERDGDIFEDEFCVHAIEMRGGKSTPDELENLSLRVISKTPDKNIKSFVNKLQQHLKKSDNYGVGVGSGGLYSKTFYNREQIVGKTLWFDFELKSNPLVIDAHQF
ncbi:hypothetical protein [Pedobacter miscanthi]|uniref:Uncharacterized protein n=1 Tax=Pedobacter miscanthi TaxID=2259170 RepID=A0A366KZM5_9SPHI|nr:hypothetical protein [Pedobacter miscanthi]RBQ06693.1 hypothetical protein DRW42_12980 [Pedobacter miscanthi]